MSVSSRHRTTATANGAAPPPRTRDDVRAADRASTKIVTTSCLCRYFCLFPLISLVIFCGIVAITPFTFFPDREDPTFWERPDASSLSSSSENAGKKTPAPLVSRFQGQHTEGDVPEKLFNADLDRYAFGRYRRPFHGAPTLHSINGMQYAGQEKRFNWFSVTAQDWLIGCAFLQFHYNGGFVIHAFNRKTLVSYSKQVELPLIGNWLWGPRFVPDPQCLETRKSNKEDCEPSVSQGCVFFDLIAGTNAFACVVPGRGMRLKINSTVYLSRLQRSERYPHESRIEMDVIIDLGHEFLNFVFPFGQRRPSIVSKAAARAVRNYSPASVASTAGSSSSPNAADEDAFFSMKIGNETIKTTQPALGAFDITRGLLQRLTVWKWLSFSTGPVVALSAGGGEATSPTSTTLSSYGMHISRGVYDTPSNVSTESTIFVNGTSFSFYDVPDVTFRPENASLPSFRTRWFITGTNMKLTFTPHGHFHGNFHYVVLDGDLFHMWGLLEGKAPLCGRTDCAEGKPAFTMLRNVPAVLEDHYALW